MLLNPIIIEQRTTMQGAEVKSTAMLCKGFFYALYNNTRRLFLQRFTMSYSAIEGYGKVNAWIGASVLFLVATMVWVFVVKLLFQTEEDCSKCRETQRKTNAAMVGGTLLCSGATLLVVISRSKLGSEVYGITSIADTILSLFRF
jgi:hypothetical protein